MLFKQNQKKGVKIMDKMENWSNEKLRKYFWILSDNQGKQNILVCSDNEKRLRAKQILIERLAW